MDPSSNNNNNDALIKIILAIIRSELPSIRGAKITAALMRQVEDIIIRNAKRIIPSLFTALAGVSVVTLLPSLVVAFVNMIGFTSSGAGSLAAWIQSALYGAFTSGIFSALQSFGAKAMIASPLVLGLAGSGVVLRGAYCIWRWWFGDTGPDDGLVPLPMAQRKEVR